MTASTMADVEPSPSKRRTRWSALAWVDMWSAGGDGEELEVLIRCSGADLRAEDPQCRRSFCHRRSKNADQPFSLPSRRRGRARMGLSAAAVTRTSWTVRAGEEGAKHRRFDRKHHECKCLIYSTPRPICPPEVPNRTSNSTRDMLNETLLATSHAM